MEFQDALGTTRRRTQLFELMQEQVEDPNELEPTLRAFRATFPGNQDLTVEERKELFELGGWEFFSSLMNRHTENPELQLLVRETLKGMMCVKDFEDDAENEIVNLAVEKRAIEIIVEDLSKTPIGSRDGSICMLEALASISMFERHAERIVDTGAVDVCMEAFKRRKEFPHSGYVALSTLANLACWPEAQTILLNIGALHEARSARLFYSGSERDSFALKSTSLICRLMPGFEDPTNIEDVDVVEETNGLIFSQWVWLLDQVVMASMRSENRHWRCTNPADLALDISLLASLDRNKNRLIGLIPRLLRILQVKKTTNIRLVKHCLVALSDIGLVSEARLPLALISEQLLAICAEMFASDNTEVSLNIRQIAKGLHNYVMQLPPTNVLRGERDEAVQKEAARDMSMVD